MPDRTRGPALLAAALLVLVPLGVEAAGWQIDHLSGRARLAADFPIDPGPMPATFDRFAAELRTGALTGADMLQDHDGLRTLAVLRLLADRRGEDRPGVPTGQWIVDHSVG